MARLWQSGFELNSSGSNVEFTSISNVLSTAVVRSGTYSGLFDTVAAGAGRVGRYEFAAANSAAGYYLRTYIYFTAFPDTGILPFLGLSDTATSAFNHIAIQCNTNGTLELWNLEDNAQVGSDSSALSLNTWYSIELKADFTTIASTAIDARINGSSFASGTVNLANGARSAVFGFASAVIFATAYFDDIALNDDSGSSQTSYPGSGKIIHLTPNAVGDVSNWTLKAGQSGDHYLQVDEVTPDDVTTFVGASVLDTEELYGVTNSGIGASDTVNVVAVGVRYNNVGSSFLPTFKLEIEKTDSGTKTQGTAITPANSTWVTNANSIPRNYSLVTYQDPDGANWTQTTLDSMQIGQIITTGNSFNDQISTIWASVDYTPAGAAAAVSSNAFMTTNTGFWGA